MDRRVKSVGPGERRVRMAVRGTVERDEAELPLLTHLKKMGWRHVHGPDLQGAEERAYRDIFLDRAGRSPHCGVRTRCPVPPTAG